MYEYKYPNNVIVYISDKTHSTTPHTFLENGCTIEPESIEYFFGLIENNPTATVLDIGAQTGLYALYVKNFPELQYYAFEPNKNIYNLLCDNIKLNNITNVNTYNFALGSKQEKKLLYIPNIKESVALCTLGNTPLRFNDFFTEEVDVITMDSIFFDKNIKLDYIKIDTEGWEYFILKGGRKTIEVYHPDIFMEINPINCKQCDVIVDDIFKLMYEMNYKFINVVNGENYHFIYDNN